MKLLFGIGGVGVCLEPHNAANACDGDDGWCEECGGLLGKVCGGIKRVEYLLEPGVGVDDRSMKFEECQRFTLCKVVVVHEPCRYDTCRPADSTHTMDEDTCLWISVCISERFVDPFHHHGQELFQPASIFRTIA